MASQTMQTIYDPHLKLIVEVWSGLIRRAYDEKQDFTEQGQQVECFYSGKPGFMWRSDYVNKYMGGSAGFKNPMFKIEFNKAYEYIALMWPMLFWQMADRKVKPMRSMEPDEAMALAANDPAMQQMMTMLMEEQATTDAKASMRAKVQERILNILPRLQPHGGLTQHAGMAVFDALLKGAGFLTTEAYKFPGSEKNLVGSFYVDCDRILVDPNCTDPLWSNARWMAIRHEWEPDECDRHFELPEGTCQPFARKSTSGAQYNNDPKPNGPAPKPGDPTARNVVVWYEIFSRGGMGNRLIGKNKINEELSQVGGDFPYLCICEHAPWPLNFSGIEMLALDHIDSPVEDQDQWAQQKLSWPTPYWRHNEWPVNKLTFYPAGSRKAWPLPPMSPAIGEMTVVNILISVYTELGFKSKDQILGVLEGFLSEDIQTQLVNGATQNPIMIKIKSELAKSVQDVISFIQRPGVSGDIIQVINFLFGLIEQRTGMSPVLYGESGDSNARSATEYSGRRETVNIRPDFMRKRVGEWMSETAAKELFASYIHMTSEDVAADLGPVWTMVWNMLVENEDPDTVLRSSECWVEASDIGRPTKERDTQMLQQLQQYLLPILSGHGAQTGDWEPYNAFVEAYGVAANLDIQSCKIPSQQPDASQAASQQQSQQLEYMRLQAEITKINAEARRAELEGQAAVAKSQVAMRDSQTKAQQVQATAIDKQQEYNFRLSKAQQDQVLSQQSAEHSAQLKQQAAEHAAALRERAAELQGAQAEHTTTLKERDAQARVAATDAATQAKMDGMALSQEGQQRSQEIQQAAAEQRHHQTMAEREASAQQRLLSDLLSRRQQMQLAAESHQQQMGMDEDRAHQEAQRSNIIMSQRLLQGAAEAQIRSQRSQTSA